LEICPFAVGANESLALAGLIESSRADVAMPAYTKVFIVNGSQINSYSANNLAEWLKSH
jgi:hypothetical protein